VHDANFHLGWKWFHAFFKNMFNFSHWWINIWFTKDGICTLVDIVIVDPTWTYLSPWSCTTQKFIVSDAVQAKERNYCNWHLTKQFLPLIVEIFRCLHKHVDLFLHNCASAIWSLERLEGHHLYVSITFLCKFFSIMLQRL
jgi:hypothetical protein